MNTKANTFLSHFKQYDQINRYNTYSNFNKIKERAIIGRKVIKIEEINGGISSHIYLCNYAQFGKIAEVH